MQVASYIADFLYAQGVRTVYMLSGTGSVHLDDAFATGGRFKYICARHEAAAVTMAQAEAKLTGRIGVAVVTTGPGGINAINGASEAWVDSVPVLILSGQVPTYNYVPRARSFGLQGFNIIDIVRHITKYAAVVTEPDSIRYHLQKAIHSATHGRPGPAWLDICLDVQSAAVNAESLATFDPPPIPRADAAGDAAAILRLLQAARRPLIVAGQGVRQAGAVAELRRLADRLNVPVQTTRLALDLLPFSVPYHMGLGGVRGRPSAWRIAREADLVLSLGSSLAHGFVGEDFAAFAPEAKVVMVERDEDEIAKPGVALHRVVRQDVAAVVRELLARLPDYDLPSYAPWLARCQALKRSHPVVRACDRGNPINSYHFIERLDFHSRANDIFVSDAGSSYYIAGQALRFEHGQRELTSGAFATMGMTLPLAIGAAVSRPEARVLAITGDGSIETNIQELHTISQYGLPIKIFVINNGGYASIRDSQDEMCGGRYTDVEEILDFAKVAAAFALPYRLIERADDMDSLLEAVLAERGPVLVEVVCDRAQKMIRPQKEAVETETAAAAERD